MKTIRFFTFFFLWVSLAEGSYSQNSMGSFYPPEAKSFIPYSKTRTVEIPVLALPERCKNTILPSAVDNSNNTCFSGILDQGMFCSCQQYAGVSFSFAYEINRLRGLDGKLPDNQYPAHYTYNFFDNADWTIGVSYFHSFDVLTSQGQMTMTDYGSNEAMNAWGWPSGYDKYYRGMHNRLGGMYSIPVNTAEGQNTLKHYLYDHLDGSAVGGVALFSAEAPYGPYFTTLPSGTPEGGKPVLIYFDYYATHGGTVIGYNDSIRYDLNKDGKYTNDIDINGDGIVDIRDWEIGGFRIANSYGSWWGDKGFYYVLYSTMAQPYGAGGIQDCKVQVLEPLSDYQPLLTVKASLRTACRDHFRVRAGISTDTSLMIPEHSIDFPIFNFQGNRRNMQGFDTIPGSDTLEFGLDLTPLLSYAEPGQPARFFLIVDNQDSLMNIAGEILHLAFINYRNGATVFTCPSHNIPCITGGTTYASVVASPVFDKIRITTQDLPAFSPSRPYQQQLSSSGGISPDLWSLDYSLNKSVTDSVFKYYPGSFPAIPNINVPYIPVALPFSFPFYGKQYDTAWVNVLGLVSFDNQVIPFPYTIDDEGMLKSVTGIFPAFSRSYFSGSGYADSICLSLSPSKAVFRWFMHVNMAAGQADNNLELVIYPGGRFETRYGTMTNPLVQFPVYTGWSGGDGTHYDIEQIVDRGSLQGQSVIWTPAVENDIFHLDESGLLTAQNLDSTRIYTVNARVDDAGHQHDSKVLQVSSTGLGLTYFCADSWDGKLRYHVPVSLGVTVSNGTLQGYQNLSLRLMCNGQEIKFQDSTRIIAALAAGSSLTVDHAFNFSLSSLVPDQNSVQLTLLASEGSSQWSQNIILPVSAPVISVPMPAVIDGDNLLLDPGEAAEMEISLDNSGHLTADSLNLSLVPSDTLIKVLSAPTVQIGHCPPPGNQKYRFLVQAARHVNPGQTSVIKVQVSGANIPEQEFQFSFLLGRNPVAVAYLSQGSLSAVSMTDALDSLKVPYALFTNTSFNPELYNAVFLLDGTNTMEFNMGMDAARIFADYLASGGNLYLEGNSVWSANTSLPLLPYFHYTTTRVPAYFYDRVKGCSQTLGDGMNFSYLADVTGSIYDFKPKDSALSSFQNSDASPHSLQVYYTHEGYKTIGSIFEFGGLQDSAYPSTQRTLMQRYLDFFNINVTGPYPLFHTTTTSPLASDTLTFLDDSYPDIVSRQWQFPGGTPSVSTDRNPVVSYAAKGSYSVTLTVSDGKETKSLTRRNFINIQWGLGIPEPSQGNLMIWPNPARDHVRISFPGTASGNVRFELLGLAGNVVLVQTAELSGQKDVLLNISSLKPGLYVMKARNGSKQWIAKLIVQ